MSSWIAAATSYSTNNLPMIPFYIYYSMFGLQRVGDLAWLAGDMRARGFLLGGTAGRTTLNGEGLQHEDGHSHVLASTIPNCVSYDPTFCLRGRDDHPRGPAPHGAGAGGRLLLHHPDERELPAPGDARRQRRRASSRGCTCCAKAAKGKGPRVQLMGIGDDPARGAGRGGPAARRLQGERRRVERDQLQRAAARRHERRALEPAASRQAAAQELRRDGPRRPRRAGRGVHRLHAQLRRPGARARLADATGCSAPTASAAATIA